MKVILLVLLVLVSVIAETGEVWSDYRIIDIHAHIGTFRGYDLSVENLLDNMKRYGIALALISNIDGADLTTLTRNLNETDSNNETSRIVRLNPGILRGLVWTRPPDGSPENLEPFLKEKLSEDGDPVFVGMKFHPNMNQFRADDSNVDAYLLLCEKYRIPAVFHCGDADSFSSPQRIYNVAKRHPVVPIILYHMGAFGPHQYAIEVVKRSLINRDADLYLETAQADPDAVLQAVRELGSQRVLFGTDATYYGKDHYAHYEKLIGLLRKELPEKDFVNIVRNNAQRLFKLK